VSFDLIALTVLVVGWMTCGVAPWLALSVATRGTAGLAYLPLCMFVAVVSAMMVPILGATGVAGLWLSFAAAFLGPAVLLAIRRFSLGPGTAATRPAADIHPGSPESVE
jgi:hypothetical protein